MATYLPNSNDYIAKTKAYTPDFKFLADTLGRRQDRYNTNYKNLNDLYGKVVHADLSHTDNIHKRDEYANLLVPKIQQLTGTDFSLQQNADAARALFKPFFEDKTVVRDIVFTKRFNNETQKAESFRKSPDAKERDKYWQDGVDRLNFSMQDFKAGSLEESMSERLPEYVEDPDLIERGIEYLMNYEGKGKKLEMTDVVFDEQGVWMTTMTNGSVITNRPTGVVDKETGVMGTYNPAANIIAKTILDDPLISRGYATAAYVKARKFYENENNIAKYGSKENAEKYILNQIINQSKTGIEDEIKTETSQKEKLTQTKNSWEKYLEKYPKANTKSMQDYLATIGAITAIDKGIQKDNKTILDISREYKDLAEMRNIAYQAYMNYSINKDVLSAANEYATTTMKVTDRKINPLVDKKLDHEYRMLEIQEKYDNEKKLADYKNDLEGGGGLNLDGPGMEPGMPDAELNLSTYQNEGDLIGDNRMYMHNKQKQSVNEPMFAAVEAMHTKLANIWSSADYDVDPTGIEVEVFMYSDGSGYAKDDNPTLKEGKWEKKFLLWQEAKEYLINGPGRTQDDLEDHYKEILQKYHHQISLGKDGSFEPMLGTAEFNSLNTQISQLESQIRNGKADVLTINEKGNKTYNDAYNMILETNPDLKNKLDYSGGMITGEEGKERLISLAEFKKQNVASFKQRVANLNLPKELKTQNEFVAELLASPEGQNGQYTRMGMDIRTPGHGARIYHRDYLLKLFPKEVSDQFDGANYMDLVRYFYSAAPSDRPKPSGETQENWDAAVLRQMDIDTRLFKADTKMVLQSDNPVSGLNRRSEELYNTVYDAMNTGMTSSVAGSGFPTFSARNEFMLKDQINDGSIAMTDNFNGKYIHGNASPEVAGQLTIALNAVNRLDKSNVVVKLGDPSMHIEKGGLTDMEWSEGMDQILAQIRTDLRQPASATNMPNISITYNENLGGKSGWTLQLDQDYIKKLRSSATVDNNVLSKAFADDKNTITIYVDKGMVHNPLDIINMDVSSTRRIIRDNGEYSHIVPQGGNIRAWTGSDGNTIYTQMTQGTWIQDENKEWNYREVAGEVRALPPGEAKIDEMFRTQREHLENLANKNRITQDKNLK